MPVEPLSEAPPLPAGLPEDWRYPHDLPCTSCGYNLRMQREPRCPECGVVFRWQQRLQSVCPRCGEYLGLCDAAVCPTCALALDWAAVLSCGAASAEQFEYAARPRRRLLPALRALAVPNLFWRGLVLEATPVPARLRRFRTACVWLLLAGAVALLIGGSARLTWSFGFNLTRAAMVTMLPVVLTALFLPIFTSLALPAFTPTLARFSIRRDQLLRVSAYGFAGAAWLGILLLGLVLARQIWRLLPPGAAPLWYWYGYRFPLHELFQVDRDWSLSRTAGFDLFSQSTNLLLVAVCFGWWWFYLGTALRRYLRLSPTDATAIFISTQLAGLLLFALLLLGIVVLDVVAFGPY